MEQYKIIQPKEGVTLLVVKITEECAKHHIGINQNGTRLFLWDGKGLCTHLPFPCKLLGISTDVPEEVWQTLLPTFVCAPFRNRYINFLDIEGDLLTSAIKSGMSFLQANEVYSVNPYGEMPIRRTPFMGKGQYTEDQLEFIEEHKKEFNQWQRAEANTGTWVILQRV